MIMNSKRYIAVSKYLSIDSSFPIICSININGLEMMIALGFLAAARYVHILTYTK